jgi:hypothetical protein
MIKIEKPIKFSQHALDNIFDRGISREEVEQAIRTGERSSFEKKEGPLFTKTSAIMAWRLAERKPKRRTINLRGWFLKILVRLSQKGVGKRLISHQLILCKARFFC